MIGVSAIKRNGAVPDYSNRDAVYNDLTAPGDAIFSTVPTNLEEDGPTCFASQYSDCGPFEFRKAIGTSFAAPQVAAAAALLLGADPTLRPEQVAWLLERSAADQDVSTGCAHCPRGRDLYTGWGALDVDAALTLLETATLPPADALEPNDDAGPWAHSLPPLPRIVTATLDYWDDNLDVYRIRLRKGQRLFARTSPSSLRLALWAPRTKRIESLDAGARLAQGRSVGAQQRLAYRARTTGTYYLAVKLVAPTHDPVAYRLALAAVLP